LAVSLWLAASLAADLVGTQVRPIGGKPYSIVELDRTRAA